MQYKYQQRFIKEFLPKAVDNLLQGVYQIEALENKKQ